MAEQEDSRPPKRKARIDVPLDPDLYDQAKKKAMHLPGYEGSEGDAVQPSPTAKLRAAIRAFLRMWVQNEGEPDADAYQQELKRAQKRKKRKK